MSRFMTKYEPQAYALLRIVAGALYLCHGSQKVFGFPGEPHAGTPGWILWTAGPLEIVGGALIALGLATRWAAFISSGVMAAAYWMAHGHKALLPISNGGELSALYCFVFLFIAARGAGKWSLDGENDHPGAATAPG